MRKEPNYLSLMLSLLTSVVLVTSAVPRSLLGIVGVLIAALSLMVTAYTLINRRRPLLLAVLLGAAAFLPFTWFSLHPEALAPRWAMGIYTLTLGFWRMAGPISPGASTTRGDAFAGV